jgi:hypothetical protein
LKAKFKLVKGSVKRLHGIDDADYFGEEYSDYVSNSSLKYINPDEGGSAFNYKNRVSQQSDSLELGSAIHKMILEGDKYILSEVDKPNGKLGVVVDKAYWLYNLASHLGKTVTLEELVREAATMADYYTGVLTEDRINDAVDKGRAYFEFLVRKGDRRDIVVLTPALKGRLEKSVSSIKANRDIMSLIRPSGDIFDVRHFREDVIVAEAMVNGRVLKLKCKVDSWSIDFDNKVITLNDLKSTGASIQGFMGKYVTVFEPGEGTEILSRKEFVGGSFQKWHYHRQMGMYAMMLKASCVEEFGITDIEQWEFKVNMVVAETLPPYNAYSFDVHNGWLEAGVLEMEDLLARVAWHEQNGWDKIMELDDSRRETVL